MVPVPLWWSLANPMKSSVSACWSKQPYPWFLPSRASSPDFQPQILYFLICGLSLIYESTLLSQHNKWLRSPHIYILSPSPLTGIILKYMPYTGAQSFPAKHRQELTTSWELSTRKSLSPATSGEKLAKNLRCSFNLAINKLWEERQRQGVVALACLPCICFINNKGILWAKDHPKPD